MAVSALWVTLALGAGGAAVVTLFEESVKRQFDARAEAQLILLAAAVADGQADAAAALSEPGFARVWSGWYWQASPEGAEPIQSRSLFGYSLDMGEPRPEPSARAVPGPDGQELRAISQLIAVDGRDWALIVAVDRGPLEAEIADLRSAALWTGAALWLALVAAAVLLVRTALSPLASLRRAVAARRAEETGEIAGDFPTEVAPLVEDLNAVLGRNAALRERGRRAAANLAHALKTPAAILRNELGRARRGQTPDLDMADAAVARIALAADRHLSSVGDAREDVARGEDADAALVAREVVAAMARVTPRIDFEARADAPARAPATEADLYEICGNLVENAAKWATARVRAEVAVVEGCVEIRVEDDGPGIPEARRAEAMGTGRRLDESRPGEGLGLAIVADAVARYAGEIELGDSPLGGLQAQVRIPQRGVLRQSPRAPDPS